MTFSAGRDGNVRLQTSQRRGLRDVDMTTRALAYVLFFLPAAVVHVLRRDPRRKFDRHVRSVRELVTTVAVICNWLLRFPVTVEA